MIHVYVYLQKKEYEKKGKKNKKDYYSVIQMVEQWLKNDSEYCDA